MSLTFNEPSNIFLLFSQDNQTLSVPPYQRPYSWKRENIEELIESIKNFREIDWQNNSESKLFLGTVLIHKKESDSYDVIDGQQRITSLTLLLGVLFNRIKKELSENNIEEERKQEIQDLLEDRIKNAIYSNKRKEIFRLEPLEEDNGSFQNSMRKLLYDNDFFYECLPSKIEKKSSRFEKNIMYINRSLEEYYKDIQEPKNKVEFYIDIFRVLKESITCLMLGVKKDDNPLLYFETLNSTGLPLTFKDLLKNYLFLNQESEEEKQKIKNLWELIFTSEHKSSLWFISSPSKNNVSHLDFFFNEVYPKLVIPSSQQNLPSLYDSYKELIKRDSKENDKSEGEVKKEKLLEIKKYAEAYYSLFDVESEIYKVFESLINFLKELKFGQYYHVLVIVVSENKDDIKTLEEFRDLFFSYIYRRALLTLGTSGQNKYFQEIFKEYNDKKNSPKEDFFSLLRRKFKDSRKNYEDDLGKFTNSFSFPSDKYLESKIQGINYENSKAIKPLLISLEMKISKHRIEFFNSLELEHILPKSDIKKLKEEDISISSAYYQLGNLTILIKEDNIKCSDKKYPEKIEILKKSPQFNLTQELIKDYPKDFSIENIQERTKSLLEKIIKYFPQD